MKFLHLSDTHILKSYRDGFLAKLNVNPTENTLKAIRHINTKYNDADFIIITGDLTFNGGTEDYLTLKNILKRLDKKIFFALGNHDIHPNFRKVFFDTEDDGQYYYSENVNGLRIIALDTNLENKDGGYLDEKQLSWLEDVLKTESEKGSIIIMHHPPVLNFGEGILKDRMLKYGLSNSDEFYNVIKDSDVLAIFSGHTHKNSHFGISHTADSVAFGVTIEDDEIKIDNTIGFSYCEIKNKNVFVHNEKVDSKIDMDRTKYLLKLEGCVNFRDIGGYDTIDGSRVIENKFFRADSLAGLTENDISVLEQEGISVVIDLRFSGETDKYINPLRDREPFIYHNVSLLDGINSNNLTGAYPKSLDSMYISLIEDAHELILKALRVMIENSDKKIVFHCKAGKDRTGVIAAILLLLAGVSREEVVYDYTLTFGYMQSVFDQEIKEGLEKGRVYPEYIFKSNRETIEAFLDHIEKNYYSIEDYLLQKSMTEQEIQELKNMLRA